MRGRQHVQLKKRYARGIGSAEERVGPDSPCHGSIHNMADRSGGLRLASVRIVDAVEPNRWDQTYRFRTEARRGT